MAQNKPPKLRRACDRCTEKKIKCDNQRPCAGCIRKNTPCHYSPAYKSTLKTIKVSQVNPGFNVLIQTTTSLQDSVGLPSDGVQFVNLRRLESLARTCLTSGQDWSTIAPVIPTTPCSIFNCPESEQLMGLMGLVVEFIRKRYSCRLVSPAEECAKVEETLIRWYEQITPLYALPTWEQARQLAVAHPHHLADIIQLHALYYCTYIFIFMSHPFSSRVSPMDHALPDPQSPPTHGTRVTPISGQYCSYNNPLPSGADQPWCPPKPCDPEALGVELDFPGRGIKVAQRFYHEVFPLIRLLSPRVIRIGTGVYLHWIILIFTQACSSKPAPTESTLSSFRRAIEEMSAVLESLGCYWPNQNIKLLPIFSYNGAFTPSPKRK
ncbi:hypothetical protein H4R33_003138 [Dimargaris cristalligena]|nr:hypothetical protein H4R33_003138 [Dimargaris cristalligena]